MSESFALLKGNSLLSGAPDPGFLSSTFHGLWHEPAQAKEGQSYKENMWKKKGKECPWLCSLCQILQCFAPGANPSPVCTTANQVHLWGWWDSALLWRRSWSCKRCSSIPASGTSITRREIKTQIWWACLGFQNQHLSEEDLPSNGKGRKKVCLWISTPISLITEFNKWREQGLWLKGCQISKP